MPALSLRLPDDLDHRLDEEAHREGIPRSEVARQAISDYLARRERERFMAELVAEASTAYADETLRREALDLAEEFHAADNDALDPAEGGKSGEPGSREAAQGWWK